MLLHDNLNIFAAEHTCTHTHAHTHTHTHTHIHTQFTHTKLNPHMHSRAHSDIKHTYTYTEMVWLQRSHSTLVMAYNSPLYAGQGIAGSQALAGDKRHNAVLVVASMHRIAKPIPQSGPYIALTTG